MPSLKDMRVRINSVRQTRKITSAMKLVAASKLRRAQDQAEASRPFAERMTAMLANLAKGVAGQPGAPLLLAGTGKDEVHLLIVATADRGLCGGFNSTIIRGARRRIQDLVIEFTDAQRVAEKVLQLYEAGEFDVCTIVYNRFKSAVSQVLTFQQLVPVQVEAEPESESAELKPVYEFEPDEERILGELLPRNVAVQILGALLENAASEQGARMAAMDAATRNAGEMINKLTLSYNRQRQAQITKELMEIISGAEAL